GVLLDALFDLDAEGNVALEVGKADDVVLAVLGRRRLHGVGNHRLELIGAQHGTVEVRRIEAVEIIGKCAGGEHHARRQPERQRAHKLVHQFPPSWRRCRLAQSLTLAVIFCQRATSLLVSQVSEVRTVGDYWRARLKALTRIASQSEPPQGKVKQRQARAASPSGERSGFV